MLSPASAPARPRWLALIFVAAGVQVLVAFLPDDARGDFSAPALAVTNVLAGSFLLANVRRPGRLRRAFALATCGWALNALVVALNGAMPVSALAMERAGFPADEREAEGGFLYEHEPESPSTRLRSLGDVIPVPAGPLPLSEVISPGDVLLAAGVAVALAELTRSRLGTAELQPDEGR